MALELVQSNHGRNKQYALTLNEFTKTTGYPVSIVDTVELKLENGELYFVFPSDIRPRENDKVTVYLWGKFFGKGADKKLHEIIPHLDRMRDIDANDTKYGIAEDGRRCEIADGELHFIDGDGQKHICNWGKPLCGSANMKIEAYRLVNADSEKTERLKWFKELKELKEQLTLNGVKDGDIIGSDPCLLLYKDNDLGGKDITIVCIDNGEGEKDTDESYFNECTTALMITVLKEKKMWENGKAVTDALFESPRSSVQLNKREKLMATALFGRLCKEIHDGTIMDIAHNTDVLQVANMVTAFTGSIKMLLKAVECDKKLSGKIKEALKSIQKDSDSQKRLEDLIETLQYKVYLLEHRLSTAKDGSEITAKHVTNLENAKKNREDAVKAAAEAADKRNENPDDNDAEEKYQKALTAFEGAQRNLNKAVRAYDKAEAKRIKNIHNKQNEIHKLRDRIAVAMCDGITIQEIDFAKIKVTPEEIMMAFAKRVEQICPNIRRYTAEPKKIRVSALSMNTFAMSALFEEQNAKDAYGNDILNADGSVKTIYVLKDGTNIKLDNDCVFCQPMLLGDTKLFELARYVLNKSQAVRRADTNDILEYIGSSPFIINVSTQFDQKDDKDVFDNMVNELKKNPDGIPAEYKEFINKVQYNTATQESLYHYEMQMAYNIFMYGFYDKNGNHYTYFDTSASQFRNGKSAFIIDPDGEGWLLSAKLMARDINISPRIVDETISKGRKRNKTDYEIAEKLLKTIQDICDGLKDNDGYEINIPKGLSRFGLSASTTLNYELLCNPNFNNSEIVQYFRRYFRDAKILIAASDGKKLETIVDVAEMATIEKLSTEEARKSKLNYRVKITVMNNQTIVQIVNDGGVLIEVCDMVGISFLKRKISEADAKFFRDNWMIKNQYDYSLEKLFEKANAGDETAVELKKIMLKSFHAIQCRAPGGDTNGFGMKFVGVMYSIRGDKKLRALDEAYNSCHMIVPASAIKIFKDDGSKIKSNKFGKYIMDFNMLEMQICNTNKHNNLETNIRKMTSQYFNMLNIDGDKVEDMANKFVDDICKTLEVISKPSDSQTLVSALADLEAYGSEREINVFNRALELAKANPLMIRDERFLNYLREQVATELLEAATGRLPVKGDYLYAVCDPYASINALFAKDFEENHIEPYETMLDLAKEQVFEETKKAVIKKKRNDAKRNRKEELYQMDETEVIAEAQRVMNEIPDDENQWLEPRDYKKELEGQLDLIDQVQHNFLQMNEEELINGLINILADKTAIETQESSIVQDQAVAEAEKARDNLKDVYYVNGYSGLIAVFRSPASAQYQAQRGTAINVKRLWYLSDCLVFSCEGNWRRLAGADFDGDKFLVILNINWVNKFIINGVTMCPEIITDPKEIVRIITEDNKKCGKSTNNVRGRLTIENICRVLTIAVRKSEIGRIAKWAAADLNMFNHLREALRIAKDKKNKCEAIVFVVPSVKEYNWVSSTGEDSQEMRERDALNASMVEFLSKNHAKEEFTTTLSPDKIKQGFRAWVIRDVKNSDGTMCRTLFVEGFIERYRAKNGDIRCRTRRDAQGRPFYCGLYGKHTLKQVETLAKFYLERNKRNSVSGDMEIDATNNGVHSQFHEPAKEMAYNEMLIDIIKNKEMNKVKAASAYINIGVLGTLCTTIMSRWNEVMSLISPDKAIDMSTYICMLLGQAQVDNIMVHKDAIASIKQDYDKAIGDAMDVYKFTQNDDELKQNIDNIEYTTTEALAQYKTAKTHALTSEALALACYLAGKGGSFSFLLVEDLRELLKNDPEATGIERLPNFFNIDKDSVEIKEYCKRHWLIIKKGNGQEVLLNAVKIKDSNVDVLTTDDRQSYAYYKRKADDDTPPSKRQFSISPEDTSDSILRLLADSTVTIVLTDKTANDIENSQSTNRPITLNSFGINKITPNSIVKMEMNDKGNTRVTFFMQDKNGEIAGYHLGKKIEVKVGRGAKFANTLLNAYLLNHQISLNISEAKLTGKTIVGATISKIDMTDITKTH